MNRSKRRPEAHVTGEQGVEIVKDLLPKHWTPREYRPDYGIDLAVELFEQSGQDQHGRNYYDTLGEHFFMQVKGVEGITPIELKIPDRINVELADPNTTAIEGGSDSVLPAFSFQIETSELVTVQRMGAAMPVLLTLVDLYTSRAFFVCLNDYIDKILLPFDENFADQDTKVIHVPKRNEIINTDEGLAPLRFYAKRAKLMAAFAKFRYQQHQLEYVDNEQLLHQAAYFARVLLRYDFWSSCEWWRMIAHLHQALVRFSETGFPGLMKVIPENAPTDIDERCWTDGFSGNKEYSQRELLRLQELRQLWDQLANAGNVYEEICREWFLPTPIGQMTS
jgi:hypothetical protein